MVKSIFTELEYDELARRVVEGEITLAIAEKDLVGKYSSDSQGPKYFWHAYFRRSMPIPEFTYVRVSTKSQQILESMKIGKDETIANVVEKLLLVSNMR